MPPRRETSIVARAIFALLALVFFLGAADPSPRYFGLPRIGDFPQPHQGVKARPVMPKLDLPRCAHARSTESSVPTPLLAPERPVDLATLFQDFESTSSSLARLAPPLTRNGAGPFLRC